MRLEAAGHPGMPLFGGYAPPCPAAGAGRGPCTPGWGFAQDPENNPAIAATPGAHASAHGTGSVGIPHCFGSSVGMSRWLSKHNVILCGGVRGRRGVPGGGAGAEPPAKKSSRAGVRGRSRPQKQLAARKNNLAGVLGSAAHTITQPSGVSGRSHPFCATPGRVL